MMGIINLVGRYQEGGSAEFGDFAELGLVDDFDFSAVDDDQFFGHEGCEGADGVGGGHVGEVGQVLAAHVDFQSRVVVFQTIVFNQQQECIGEASADMLLGEVDNLGVGTAQISR